MNPTEIVSFWDTASETNALSLYNLACWYAVANAVKDTGVANTLDKARFYLAYSLGRDGERDLWNWAAEDEDLTSITHDGFLERLKLELIRAQLKYDDPKTLSQLSSRRFENAIADVISAASI